MKIKFIALFLTLAAVISMGCDSEYDILRNDISANLTADGTYRLIEEPVNFKLTDQNGDDLTSQAKFYVEGNEITGNVFSSPVTGVFHVVARYQGWESDPLTITFHDGSEVIFAKNALIEDYTGTWCGYCPRVAYGIEKVKEQTSNVVPVSIHRASDNVNNAEYDPYNFDSQALEDIINIPGYPKGLLDRTTLWKYPEPNKVQQVLDLINVDPKLGLAINTTLTASNLTIDVNVKTAKSFTNMKLVVYVLENGLIHEQHNYTSYYNGEDLIENFEHNHVLRASLTSLLGDAVPDNDLKQGHTYTRTFNVAVPANVTDSSKIEIVAFVLDGVSGASVNARKATANEQQDFEEL